MISNLNKGKSLSEFINNKLKEKGLLRKPLIFSVKSLLGLKKS